MFGRKYGNRVYAKQFFKVPVEARGWQSPDEERLHAAVERERQNWAALGTAPVSHQDKPTA